VTLTLSEQEVQLILNTLAARPYAEVMNLIPKIIEQTTERPEDASSED
jgi:hypothetical protein